MLKNLIRGGACALLATSAVRPSARSRSPRRARLPRAASPAPLVVGFVYVRPIGEAGWTYQHELGRREMERALGPRVKTIAVESVAEGPMRSA